MNVSEEDCYNEAVNTNGELGVIKEFSSTNYKNLKLKKPLRFSNLNVLVGPNNSGKSNLIKSLTLPVSIIEYGLHQTLIKNNFRNILDKFSDEDSVDFKWKFNTNTGHSDLSYSTAITLPKNKYHTDFSLNYEKLEYAKVSKDRESPFRWVNCHDKRVGQCSFPIKTDEGRTKSLFVEASNQDSVLNQLTDLFKKRDFVQKAYPTFYITAESVRDYFKKWRNYSLSSISTNNMKSNSKLRNEELFVDEEGKNFANVVRLSLSKNIGYGISYVEKLNWFFNPSMNIEKIDCEIIGNNEVSLYLIIDGVRFDLHELSDGTVRLLMLVFILTSPDKPQVLFLDEPEINLHPAWCRKLGNLIRHSSEEIQIFLSTHSPDLLDVFTESVTKDTTNLFVFNRDGDVSKLEISGELKGFVSNGWELGDLYRNGDPVIGGWPW